MIVVVLRRVELVSWKTVSRRPFLKILQKLGILFSHHILLVLVNVCWWIVFNLFLLKHFLAKKFKYLIIMKEMANKSSLFVRFELVKCLLCLRLINEILFNAKCFSLICITGHSLWIWSEKLALTPRLVFIVFFHSFPHCSWLNSLSCSHSCMIQRYLLHLGPIIFQLCHTFPKNIQ